MDKEVICFSCVYKYCQLDRFKTVFCRCPEKIEKALKNKKQSVTSGGQFYVSQYKRKKCEFYKPKEVGL